MDEKPLYDSRAIREADYRAADWVGWEKLEPRYGVVYLRRHLGGPSAPDPWETVKRCATP